MAELLGTHSYQLDPKGRVSLPARFRDAFADGVWLTIGQDGCLFCFPRVEWERRSDEVASSPFPTPTAARTRVSSSAPPMRRSSTGKAG